MDSFLQILQSFQNSGLKTSKNFNHLQGHILSMSKLQHMLSEATQSVYPMCHFVFLITWNMKLEIKFWFSFLYWSWDRKHQNKWFFDFQNSWTLKFKFEVCFSFFILIWKTKSQIYLDKYLMKLVTIPLTPS